MKTTAGVILCALALSGCATITKGTSETVDVQLRNCPNDMDCTATNKKGTWQFTAPGVVRVTKSDDALRIECRSGEQLVTRSITPTSDSSIWGNVLVGGVIGAGVDASSDAHWELQDSITLRCEQEDVEVENSAED